MLIFAMRSSLVALTLLSCAFARPALPFVAAVRADASSPPTTSGASAAAAAKGCTNPESPMISQPCLPPATPGMPPPVHIIGVRGSGESSTQNQQEGKVLNVSLGIIQQIPGSNSVGLDYPDSRPSPECYPASEAAGVTNLTNYLHAYHKRCPHDYIVLIGSSQGAAVVGDTICGRTSFGFSWTFPIGPRKLVQKIAAVVQFGDPTRNAGSEPQSWNRGTASKSFSDGYRVNGTTPRLWPQTCAKHFKTRLASYCSAGDMFCDSGHGTNGNNTRALEIHDAEVTVHMNDAIDFVVDIVGHLA